MALHDQQFLPLHPCIDRRENIGWFSGNRPSSANAAGAEQRGSDASFVIRNVRSRSFFGEGLPKMLWRQADFLSELEQLLLGELFTRVVRSALQLRGTRQHTLQARAVERAARRFWSSRIGHD